MLTFAKTTLLVESCKQVALPRSGARYESTRGFVVLGLVCTKPPIYAKSRADTPAFLYITRADPNT